MLLNNPGVRQNLQNGAETRTSRAFQRACPGRVLAVGIHGATTNEPADDLFIVMNDLIGNLSMPVVTGVSSVGSPP